jgi:hypothetical protein
MLQNLNNSIVEGSELGSVPWKQFRGSPGKEKVLVRRRKPEEKQPQCLMLPPEFLMEKVE